MIFALSMFRGAVLEFSQCCPRIFAVLSYIFAVLSCLVPENRCRTRLPSFLLTRNTIIS